MITAKKLEDDLMQARELLLAGSLDADDIRDIQISKKRQIIEV